jgi:putative oligomerization/nucleic acid binding protein
MAAASGALVGTLTSGSRARWLAWASVVLYAALAGISIALEARFVGRVGLPDLWLALVVLGYAVIGALIVNTHRSHVIGWMFCGAALSFGFSSFAGQYAIQALVVAPGTLPFGEAMAWFGFWTDMPGIAVVALFLPLLFPDGRLPSSRWRPVAYFAAASVLVAVIVTMLAPATYADAGYPSIRNPFGLDQYAGIFETLGLLLQPLLLLLVVVSGVALFYRVRRGGTEERQQIKWFAFAGAVVLASFVIEAASRLAPDLAGAANLVAILGLSAIPFAVGIAILRYRLYDIDLIINRTIVYALLTAILAGVYTAAVAFFQRVFLAISGENSDLAIVMTLFVLATVFTPVKNTLQGAVDRRIKPAAPPAARSASIDDLLMLSELHDRGVLTDEEFAAKKKQVLGI